MGRNHFKTTGSGENTFQRSNESKNTSYKVMNVSHTNASAQVFYFQPMFRAHVLAHRPNAAHEMSLLDDLRFLFQMLLQSNRVPCQASNLLRLLKRLPEAASVGLLEAQEVQSLNPAMDARILHISHERSLARRVVKLSRFCLDMVHKEAADLEHHTSNGALRSGSTRPPSGAHSTHSKHSKGWLQQKQHCSIIVLSVKIVNVWLRCFHPDSTFFWNTNPALQI